LRPFAPKTGPITQLWQRLSSPRGCSRDGPLCVKTHSAYVIESISISRMGLFVASYTVTSTSPARIMRSPRPISGRASHHGALRAFRAARIRAWWRQPKDEDGVASTITRRCRSRSMDSRSPRGELSPPHQLPKLSSRNLPYPKVIDPEAPPLRPERHVPNSIATLRRRLIIELVANLSNCRASRRNL
jgi:hypothetical protein